MISVHTRNSDFSDGLKFYCSANNVILCPGDEKGVIYPCYFSNAVTRYPSKCQAVITTVNVLKFRTLYSFCSQIKCWFSGL